MAATYTVHTPDAGMKLVEYLAMQRRCSLRKAKALLDNHDVMVNGRRVWMAKHVVRRGDTIEVQGQPPPPALLATTEALLFEGRDYLVVNKPAGILSNGPDSLETAIRQARNDRQLQAVHRLDRDTSGCLCVARHADAFARAVAFFKQGSVHKQYNALVKGNPTGKKTTLSAPINGLSALSRWHALSVNETAAHVQVRIETGRTHQIRRHFADMGHPVLGDRRYFTGRMDDPRLRRIPRQMLHASQFEAPLNDDGTTVRVVAPLPKDFLAAMHTMNLHVAKR